MPASEPRHRDRYGSALMIVVGVAVAAKASHYDLGTLTTMGPGFFPLAHAVVMTGVGERGWESGC